MLRWKQMVNIYLKIVCGSPSWTSSSSRWRHRECPQSCSLASASSGRRLSWSPVGLPQQLGRQRNIIVKCTYAESFRWEFYELFISTPKNSRVGISYRIRSPDPRNNQRLHIGVRVETRRTSSVYRCTTTGLYNSYRTCRCATTVKQKMLSWNTVFAKDYPHTAGII